jgi:hypothetical protein
MVKEKPRARKLCALDSPNWYPTAIIAITVKNQRLFARAAFGFPYSVIKDEFS